MHEEPTLFGVRRALDKTIQSFLRAVASHPSIEEGRAYARQHGQFTMPVPGVGKNTYIVFTPASVKWHFTADSLSDDYLVITDGNCWELYHDRYGTGTNLVRLSTETTPFVRGVNSHQFQEIAWSVEGNIETFKRLYTNEPAQTTPTAPGLSQREWKIVAAIAVAAILLVSCSGLFLAFLHVGE